ncbi:polysaccharide polymerase [Pediococcus pentosaceus]|uniref:polysaccharide polymerase n=1 Tax=Pediococcus pentosaceus TaxID=1255 RepID=UPI003163ABFC
MIENRENLKNYFKRNSNVKTMLFTMGYIIWLFSYLIVRLQQFETSYSPIIKIAKYMGLAIAFLVICIDLKNYFSIKNFIIGILLLVFIFVNNGFLGGVSVWWQLCIFIFAAKRINFKFFLKAVLIFLCLYYGGTILLSQFGIIANNATYRATNVRDSLGFGWSTWPVHGFLYIVSIYSILRNKNIRIIEIILLEFINMYLYMYTNTRSPMILITLYLCFIVMYKYMRIDIMKIKFFRIAYLWIAPILTLIIYWISKNYSTYAHWDSFLSGRLLLGFSSLQQFGVHLFGQPILFNTNRDVIGTKYLFVDSSFLQYMIRFGIVSLVILLVITILFQKRLLKTGNTILMVSFTLVLVNGFLDPEYIEPYYNVFLILFAALFNSEGLNGLEDIDKEVRSNSSF